MTEQLFYCELKRDILALIEGEYNHIAIMANVSALLFERLEQINWVGFYLLEMNELVLGPFQGKIACTRIPLGKGVCGSAVAERKSQRVADVHVYPGHIACDTNSQSELVIPIYVNDKIYGVLDIDSPIYNRFSAEDEAGLSEVVQVLALHLGQSSRT